MCWPARWRWRSFLSWLRSTTPSREEILAVEADLDDSCFPEVTKDPQVLTLNRMKMI